MAKRKQFLGDVKVDPELMALMEARRGKGVTEEELRKQRISFAYGNAMKSEGITLDSVKQASKFIRLQA